MELPSISFVVVDDEPLVPLGIDHAFSVYPQLSLIGTADDGCVGVELVLQTKPDVVLMDIGLPGIDGIEATRQLKKTMPQVKVVMLTSHRNETEILGAFFSGADAYCIKGGEIDLLLTAMITVHQGGVYLDPLIAQLVINNLRTVPTGEVIGELTSRELDVLELLVEGHSNPQIAKQLHISSNTVKFHMRGLMNKLTASDRVNVAVKALRAGVI